jgi:predicted  nucleic acid-binding Zn-ribbon protein
VSLLVLAMTTGWIVLQGVRAWKDAWVAPLQLSPDQEQVVQLRQRLLREQYELSRVRAEVTKADGEIAAIDEAIEQLGRLRRRARQAVAWQARIQSGELSAASRTIELLERQRSLLTAVGEREGGLRSTAERDFTAGFLGRTTLERARTAADQVDAALVENQLLLEQAREKRRQAGLNAGALSAGLDEAATEARHPEVAVAEEREARLVVELSRLKAERRGLEATRQAALEAVDRAEALLAELRSRPLFRALEQPTTVVFVPYSQLDSVEPGHTVLSCVAGVFNCHHAGVVRDLVAGEVVTQDPWGDLARGQYALVELSDDAAVRKKVLRVRSP